MTTQIWSLVQPPPRLDTMSRRAEMFESAGWDGILIPDSQCLAPDALIAMTLAVTATTRLQVGTGVTNPATRHPAVLAGAAASLNVLAPGRVTVGIGRGDSSLAYLGQGPATLRHLEQFVGTLRAYLGGDAVDFADLGAFRGVDAQPVESVKLSGGPSSSRLQWLAADRPRAQVEVAASGPRAIEFAARGSDGVLLALGADEERLRWGADRAREFGATRVSAFVNLVCLDDVDLARRLGRTMLSAFARFSAMDGRVRAPMDETSRQELSRLHGSYDMRDHGGASGTEATHAGTLSDDFVDSFGIFGPTGHCLERLAAISALGIDRIIIVGPTAAESPDAVAEARRRTAEEILPAFRDLDAGNAATARAGAAVRSGSE